MEKEIHRFGAKKVTVYKMKKYDLKQLMVGEDTMEKLDKALTRLPKFPSKSLVKKTVRDVMSEALKEFENE